MAIFDDFSWSDVAPAVAMLGGALLQGNANANAQRDYQQAQQANVATINAGKTAAIESIKAGTGDAIATNNATTALANERAAPGINQQRQTLAIDPNRLTPQQEIAMKDASRTAINNISPGMRGSGRAVAAINDDLVNRTKANFVATNTANQNNAAAQLAAHANAGYQAQGAVAGEQAAAGNNVANVNTNAATNVGKAQVDTGTVNANADTATGSVAASSLGAIGSIIANSNKDAARNGRYEQYKKQAEV